MVMCSIEGCTKESWQKGMCTTHYQRMRRHGSIAERGTPRGAAQAFLREGANADHDQCVLWPYARGKTYGRVGLEDAHRAACVIKRGPPPSAEHEAAHSCGAGLCVNGNHLRWALHIENEADKLLHGTRPRGETHGAAKLTEVMVRNIRTALASKEKQIDIAARFNVTPTAVSMIKRGLTWGWLV